MLLASDRLLLQRFRAGESQAMGHVFEQYCESLAQFVRNGFVVPGQGDLIRFRGVADRSELHDVIAETFRRAFEDKARQRYDGVGPYGAYLKTIARNLVVDRLRAGSARDLQPDREVDLPAEGAPDSQYEDAELGALIAAFRDTLTAPERKLLALRYEDGLSQEQVAERLGRSRRWVRTGERDIRARLLRHLEGTGYLAEG